MRKILIIATIVLAFVIALLFIFNSAKRVTPTTEKNTIAPTTVSFETFNREEIINAGQSLAPYETENFRFDYSPEVDKMVVTEKTQEGYQEYVGWISDNGLNELASNPEVVLFEDQFSTGSDTNSSASLPSTGGVDKSKTATTPDLGPLIEVMNVFVNFGQGLENIQTTPGPSPASGQPTEGNLRRLVINPPGWFTMPSVTVMAKYLSPLAALCASPDAVRLLSP